MDRLIGIAATRHRHTGVIPAQLAPSPPTLVVSTSGGTLLPNSAVYYRYSLVDDQGQEQMASEPGVIYTAPQVEPSPTGPVLTTRVGTLRAGQYSYAFTFWTGSSDQETTTSPTSVIALRGFGGVTITRPTTPTLATGWNIYRRAPDELSQTLLASLPIATMSLNDTGLLKGNLLHKEPRINRSMSSNSVALSIPGGLPTHATFKVYRSYDLGNWADSYVGWSGVEPFVDTGHHTQPGFPPMSGVAVAGPPKVNFVDAVEVQGILPPTNVVVTEVANFSFGGLLEIGDGPYQWVNEFSYAALLSMRLTLGRDSTPANDAVQVGLDWLPHGESAWVPVMVAASRVFADIQPGSSTGDPVSLQEADLALTPGDALRPVIIQVGGGSPPTDADLNVDVAIRAWAGTGA
jgi:hypothetical protein